MNFTVTVEAPELVGALNKLAEALGNSNPLSGVSIGTESKVFTADKKIEEPKNETPESEETPLAKKTMYFKHEVTDAAVIVKKGEPLDFLSRDIFDEISKAEYESLLAAQQKEDAEPEQKIEESTPGITLDVLTTKTREFIQANPANRTKLKSFLDEKQVKKITELPQADYQAALHFMEVSTE